MSDELRELLDQHAIYQEELYEELLSWHIHERRKWALSLLPKEIPEEEWMGGGSEYSGAEAKMYNQAIAEMRKRIEEG